MSGRRHDHLSHQDSDDWATAAEPMTDLQEGLLERLYEEAGLDMKMTDYALTKAQASRRIEELKARISGVERPVDARALVRPEPRI